MENSKTLSLEDLKDGFDLVFLRMEFRSCDLNIGDYINFNEHYNTRGETVNPHFYLALSKFSYFSHISELIAPKFNHNGP